MLTRLILALVLTSLLLPAAAMAEGEMVINRAVFTSAVTDREPANVLQQVPAGEKAVFMFNEILNGAGQTISHRWYYNDIQIADVSLRVGADRWRTWSSKQVWHLTSGTIKVEIVAQDGTVLETHSLAVN